MDQVIDENHPWYLPPDFIELTDDDNYLLYADTDSSYLLYDLPFDKFEDIHKLVDYIQRIAKELNVIYNDALNYYVGTFANMNPKYNTMDFKSEIIAYKGFFNSKKFYALAKAWDEGTFFESKPKLKTTGGQIRKSDVTVLTKALLDEVYQLLVTDVYQIDLVQMYRIIFVELKNKYKLQIRKNIEELEFKQFTIPKKWGKTEKTIPIHVTGAKLFNTIVEDVFRPSDSFTVLKINIDSTKLIEYIKTLNIVDDKYYITHKTANELREKINVISLPPDLSSDQKTKLINIMKKLDIKLDVDDIMNFNIDMKLDPFEKLFDDNIRMRVL